MKKGVMSKFPLYIFLLQLYFVLLSVTTYREKESTMNNHSQYQLTTPSVSPNEINVTEIYGMHVLPGIENSWLSTIGEKGFIGWLQLLSMTLQQENLAKDGASVEYPTKKEILLKLGVSEKTFNRNILRPLFEVGLLDVFEDAQKNKLRKRGVPSSRIVVYRYPFNKRENLFKPLQIVRSFDTDYNSKAKLLGILGQQIKIENANEQIRMAQLDQLVPKEFDFVQDNVQNMVFQPVSEQMAVGVEDEFIKGSKIASFESEPISKGGKNATFENEPMLEGGKIASFENDPDFEGGKNASFEVDKGGIFATNDSSAGSDHFSTVVDNSKLAKMQALDIYSNTKSFNNSLLSLERERLNKINNIYSEQTEFLIRQDQMTPKMKVVFEKLIAFNLPVPSINDIFALMLDHLSRYSEADVCDAANRQLSYIYDQVMSGQEISHFYALFKHGFEGFLVSHKFVATVQSKANNPMPAVSSETNKTVIFYNWLEERE